MMLWVLSPNFPKRTLSYPKLKLKLPLGPHPPSKQPHKRPPKRYHINAVGYAPFCAYSVIQCLALSLHEMGVERLTA
jgi:hypothetical protein